MSFGLPSVKVKPEIGVGVELAEGPFGVPDPLVAGTTQARTKLGYSHPLQLTEANYHKNQEKMRMMMLRNIQGLHAPLKISMEMKAASKVGRLPFLQSSNVMNEVLSGRNLDIGFEDFLNTAEFCESNLQPHAAIEKSLGIL